VLAEHCWAERLEDFETDIVSVFSIGRGPTGVASDPQRGVGLDQTPLRVLAATTAR